MITSLDLPTVRRFAEDLNDRVRQCDSGEGTICATLEQSINHYVQLCTELRAGINQWAKAVFRGEAEFDSTVEGLFQDEIRHVLRRAKQVAARGRAMDVQCFALQGLNALHGYIADLDYVLENWVSPSLAVSPAPRVKIPQEVEQKIRERLNRLAPTNS
jgi:hypothetical protein